MTTASVCVAFRHVTRRDFWSRLVRVIAGPPVHCVLVCASGAGYHAVIGAGVERVVLTPEQIASEAWELVPVHGIDVLALRRWCEQRLGAKYDTLGAILYWTPLTTRDRWTCSEFAAEALVACGTEPSLLNSSQTPRRLRRALRARLTRSPSPDLRQAA